MFVQQRLDGTRIVESRRERVAADGLRHAGTVRDAQRHGAGTGFDQKRIGMAVVTSGEFDDLRFTRKRPRQPDRAHRRFGS